MEFSENPRHKTIELQLPPGGTAYVAPQAVVLPTEHLQFSSVGATFGVLETLAKTVRQPLQLPRRLNNRHDESITVRIFSTAPGAIIRVDLGSREILVRASEFLAGEGDLRLGLRLRDYGSQWLSQQDDSHLHIAVSGHGCLWMLAGCMPLYRHLRRRPGFSSPKFLGGFSTSHRQISTIEVRN